MNKESTNKFLNASGSKMRYDINDNGNPALWFGTVPNVAKDNYSIEFINGGFGSSTTFPVSIGGTLTYSFTASAIIPEVSTDLGSDSKRFKDVHLSGVIKIDGIQIIKEQQTNIANPTGGATIDANARTVIGLILDLLEAHGLMAG